MTSKDSEDHTNCFQFAENSSNILPSSELDPPPPVVCHFQPCRSSDLCIDEASNSQSAALAGTFESSIDDSRSFDGNHRQRTFTQADDYQDISKESAVVPHESRESGGNLFWTTLHLTVVSVGDSEDSNGYSAYRLVNSAAENEIVNSDLECVAKPVSSSSSAGEKAMPFYSSLSDLPVMSQIERVDLVWDAQNTCNVTQPRGSTPVTLSSMGKKSLMSTDRFTSSGMRASEPIGTPKTIGADVFEITPIARGGSVTSPTTALEDLSTSGSAVVSSIDERLPTNTVDSRSDSKDERVPTTSTGTPYNLIVVAEDDRLRSGGLLLGGFSALWSRLHSFLLSSLYPECTDSATCSELISQVAEDDRLRSGGLLLGGFSALWSRLHSFLLSSLYPECTDSATCSELISQRTSESSINWNPPHTSSNPSNPGRMDNIPAVGTSARGSSSSSDLFIPRPERMHFKRQPSRMFPLHPANFRSSTSSSDHSIRRMRPPRIPFLQKESKKPAVFSSPSAPDSSPHVSGSSGSSGTVQSPAVNVAPKNLPVNQSPVTVHEVSKSPEPTRLSQGTFSRILYAFCLPDALVYQPSLTLVPETPSEESDEPASLGNACAIVPESTSASMSGRATPTDDGTQSSGPGESTVVPEPVSAITEVSPAKAVGECYFILCVLVA
ncbi:hypothetical protein AHF37_02526 [Paragonimus kellicotti]|nr:hypothetical protein AHF37_02526 [Paragonimus kellicotti]